MFMFARKRGWRAMLDSMAVSLSVFGPLEYTAGRSAPYGVSKKRTFAISKLPLPLPKPVIVRVCVAGLNQPPALQRGVVHQRQSRVRYV